MVCSDRCNRVLGVDWENFREKRASQLCSMGWYPVKMSIFNPREVYNRHTGNERIVSISFKSNFPSRKSPFCMRTHSLDTLAASLILNQIGLGWTGCICQWENHTDHNRYERVSVSGRSRKPYIIWPHLCAVLRPSSNEYTRWAYARVKTITTPWGMRIPFLVVNELYEPCSPLWKYQVLLSHVNSS